MQGFETPQRTAARKAADELHALIHVDTVYADLYLRRARELLAGHMGEADFRALSRAQTEADLLPDRIRGAMAVPDWKIVQELSGRLASLKRRLQETADLRAVAQRVYDLDEVLVDPFSPGLRALAGVAASALPALRDGGLRRLEQVQASDPAWAEFYDARAAALRQAPVDGQETAASADDAPASLEDQALQALARGDLEAVQQLSARLQQAGGTTGGALPGAPSPGGALHRHHDLTLVFPDAVIGAAGALGFAPVHLGSVHEVAREIFRYAWRPRPSGPEGEQAGAVRLSVAMPADLPAALRDHLEMYLDRPFVNSGGGRYLPPLGEEDLLVEDFPEPAPGSPPVNRPLLDLLGLDRRSGLSRETIERALLANGWRVVERTGLDPRAFRLVCIPADVYVRAGQDRGWGNQPQWTHMDGFMLQNRRWLALAGGDVRFGGVYDLVGLDRDNDLDNLTTRFAVVQRRRLSSWPPPGADAATTKGKSR